MAFDPKVLAAAAWRFPGRRLTRLRPAGRGGARGPLPPRADRRHPAGDDEPARVGRRGHRHRQDEDAAAAGRALSAAGVPVFVADVKGDLAGWPTPGEPSTRVDERARRRRAAWRPAGFPVELLSLTRQAGRPAPRDGLVVRAAGARPRCWGSTTRSRASWPGLQVLRRPQAAAARLQGPAHGAATPDRRGGGGR